MIKKEKGITLVSLVITIVVMVIISSTVIYVSLDRFDINNLRKMINDIELLEDKVSNYYLKYGSLPILRNSEGQILTFPEDSLDFQPNNTDNETYYILDLEAMDGIALNYGEKGFEDIKQSNEVSTDIYIINELTHIIYYVKGVWVEDRGKEYHYISENESAEDEIPPSKPEINVISGTKNENGEYTTDVEIEIISGKDSWSGIKRTTYTIDDGTEIDITTLENNVLKLTEEKEYTIKAKSYDNENNESETTELKITISK